jgi:hypothetical protein
MSGSSCTRVTVDHGLELNQSLATRARGACHGPSVIVVLFSYGMYLSESIAGCAASRVGLVGHLLWLLCQLWLRSMSGVLQQVDLRFQRPG